MSSLTTPPESPQPASDPSDRAAAAVGRPPETSPAPRGWHRRTFASFAVANYRWFFLGQGTSLIGTWVRATAQSWLVYLLTGNRLDLGLVAACRQVPLFFSPLAGTVADRIDKRRLLMVLAVLAMVLSLALSALVWTGDVRVWHIMLIAALAGVQMAFELPTRQSYVVEMVGREHLQNAIALNSAMFNAARMVGPALAGILIAVLATGGEIGEQRGIALCFLADGLSYVAVIFALTRIRTEPRPQRDGDRWRERLAAGFRYVRGDRRTRLLLMLLSICVVFGWSYIAVMPAFARDELQLGAHGFGYLMAANGVGAALGALWVAGTATPVSRRALRRRVFGALWLFAAMVVVFSAMRNPWMAAGALAVAGFGAIAFVSTCNTLIQLAVPDHLRGRVMGIWALVFGGSMPLGSLFAGYLSQATDTPIALALSGSTCVLLSVLVRLRLPRLPATET